ncbi:Gmad2 immunoglobulin-like domain-containing protein [Natronincola ferrireducens]|uniref:PrcB C-terminal n=1 Tax=Natronincola ferrireducens TaxID=393762 RepID=A0A1G8YBG1_9FIRM|nr:Gmad2 immunoglobulin-like domain-containing protein [Natronincola ferrireducens]SDK00003.1 PrcB C-terminal [Natronincola ferrireducens]
MKKIFVYIIILVLIFVMMGCRVEPVPDPPPPQDEPNGGMEENGNFHGDINVELQDRMRIVEEDTLPDTIREWFQQFGDERGGYVYQHPDATYVKINAGEKPTGGYGISIVDYLHEEYPRIIVVDTRIPDEDDIVTQVLSYPSVILQVHTDMAVEFEVRTIDDEAFPMEHTLVFAELELPEENEEINNPVEIQGRIIAFEGSFIVRILDAEDEIIHEEHLQADAGGPEWGSFQEEIRYPLPKTKEGRIEVGEYSAKDGEYLMRDYVAVRFKNIEQ